MNRSVLYVLGCYLAWGVLPIYWKAFSAIPGLETTSHRVVWSAVVAALLLTFRQSWQSLRPVIRQPRTLLTYVATAILILANWLIYIYAINNDQIIESSLGYFMTPLVNVLLGIIFLRERPRLWQWSAILIASIGVLYLTYSVGRLPWVALGLAGSWSFYALLKKTAPLPGLEGLFLESFFLAIPLTIYLLFLEQSGTGVFGHTDWRMTLLMVMAGLVTALPLLLFSIGAKKVPMTLLGILQYVAPSMQFVIGVALYHEPFDHSQLIGFSFIWLALLLFILESTAQHRRLQIALRAH
jgi:chloramphenicol-sensitive protein RarD